ncbi:helix-turn-helix domain-containing protein [Nocardia farcinica]|uniref:Helix-turn-helix domain-containing protein n=1 Tax=Nocardia farcinica (strain IFM 10152) TaxID=247156 RepID=Q5Z3A3_NOCFA|nr:helix-turn-helix domain-containing protein [Nocardia farcinica]BAD55088.1 hypothetical protein NFA_2460 [Nocardia farcinica IFM 10152]
MSRTAATVVPPTTVAVRLRVEELHGARYCASELVRRFNDSGRPVPDWLRRLDSRLDLEIQTLMSDDGQQSSTDEPDSELVGTAEAAKILGLSARQVRRLAADLDGQRMGRELIFRRAAVTEYAAARKE